MGSKENVMPRMGSVSNQPGCGFAMRLPEDTGGNSFQVGNDSPTNPQEVSRSIAADSEQRGGRTTTSSRTDSFPPNFDMEQNPWHPLNGHSQARGVSIGHNRDSNSNTYSNDGTSTSAEPGISPNTGTISNHPTPNSTASDGRQHGQNVQNGTNNTSYETSPAPNTTHEPHRIMDGFFSTRPDYSNITAESTMTSNAYSIPETPGRTYTTPGSWGQPAPTGLTPVGEGVFRHMMGLGPIDAMDIWENGT